MKLETFRVQNCFGFVDSREIELGVPGNLVYFPGRNSSGKTSVLRAISYFEHEKGPLLWTHHLDVLEESDGPSGMKRLLRW